MSVYTTFRFWIETAERALKTGAQTLLWAWGGADVMLDLFALDWRIAVNAFAGGALLSMLTSIISAPVGKGAGPSLV